MKKILLLSFMLLLTLSFNVLAQNRTVTGTVIDENGEGLPGVNVILKGAGTGATTNIEGKYSVNIPSEGAVLQFSFIGLKSQEVEVGARSIVDITMTQDTQTLNELVVTGYGIQSKSEVTGAISSVKGEAIAAIPLQTVGRALQGQVAGVRISSLSGIPGAAANVTIRGRGSITGGSQPLWVVDGVQLNNNDDLNGVAANPLAGINPADIESIEVLKDAAAASIYGSQGANGVILITTKSGKSGKVKVNFNHSSGYVEDFNRLNVLDAGQFVQSELDALGTFFEFFRGDPMEEEQLLTLALSRSGITDPVALGEIGNLPTFDQQDLVYRRGYQTTNNLSFSGGNDITQYLFSLGYELNQGHVFDFSFERVTGRLNLNTKLADNLKFTNNLSFTTTSQENGLTGGLFFSNPTFASTVIPPTVNPIQEDGTFLPDAQTPGIIPRNLLAVPDRRDNLAVTNSLITSTRLDYSPIEALTLSAQFGLDYRLSETTGFNSVDDPDAIAVLGRTTRSSFTNLNYTAFTTANYTREFNDHGLTFLLGAEYRQEDTDFFQAGGTGLPSTLFTSIGSTAVPETATGGEFSLKRASLFGRLNYNYAQKYFFTFSGRYDGSSRFGASNRFGFFPAISGQWAIAEESFFPTSRVLSNAKIRASWGQTGNDQVTNGFVSLIGANLNNLFQNITNFGSGANFLGLSGISPQNIGNDQLQWEVKTTLNIGLDFEFFERFNFSVEAFRSINDDLLLQNPLPLITGFNQITQNLGAVRNSGLEFSVTGDILRVGDFKWNSNFNISVLDNEILELANDLEVLDPNDFTQTRVGDPIFTYFGRQYAGVNAANGRPFWRDRNNNITYNPIVTPGDDDDRQVLGDSFAEVFGGFTNTFSYKGVELSVFLQYEYGREAINTQQQFNSEFGRRTLNGDADIFVERWQNPGDVTSVPRPITAAGFPSTASNTVLSSRFIEDASYIRVKNVSVSYTFQNDLISKLGLDRLRLYGQATNLLTWTAFDGRDPEFAGTQDNGLVPVARTVIFGIELGF